MEIKIVVMRKGATKHLSLATNKQDYLSICQIFESTKDVAWYSVGELNFADYSVRDMYLDNLQGFDKWKPIQ